MLDSTTKIFQTRKQGDIVNRFEFCKVSLLLSYDTLFQTICASEIQSAWLKYRELSHCTERIGRRLWARVRRPKEMPKSQLQVSALNFSLVLDSCHPAHADAEGETEAA